MKARFIFRNNLKGTHTKLVESTADVTIIPEGTPVVIPKQPVLGGVWAATRSFGFSYCKATVR